ncbi:MAG: hypothetical protein J6J23_01970 [Clostridia bacterium]|nr:hypothetical protein [Clostridia bacterium]
MKEYLKVIEDDLFGIARRLKEIDNDYFLVFNNLLGRFEVHSNKNIGNTLSVVCPYDRVDARLLSLVRKTARNNASALIKEIEEQNEQLQQSEEQKKLQDTKDRAKELLERMKYKLK